MPILCSDGAFTVMSTTLLILGLLAETDGLLSPLASSSKRSPELCKSKECMAINKHLLSKMDMTANPCHDFYQFACGKYNNSKSEVAEAEWKTTKQLIEIAKLPPMRNDHRALKMTKEMFRYCLNHESNIKDLKKMITQLGGWALLDPNWNEKNFSLVKFYSKSMQIGYLPKSLFTIDVERHQENNHNIIVIRQRTKSSALLEEIFQSSWTLDLALDQKSSQNYLDNIFLPKFALKMEVDQQKMKHELYQYIQIRKLFVRINEEPRNIIWKKLSHVKTFFNNIPWNDLLSTVFKPIPISDDDDIQIDCPRCLHLVNKAVHNISTKLLANYLTGSFVYDIIMSADNDLMKDWLQYTKISVSKEDYCADTIFSPFRRVMDYEYTNRRYFDKSLIPMVSKFTQKFKTAMENILQNNTKMDFESKQHAIEKVKEMVFKIAYDDEISKGQQALQYYDDLDVNPNSKSYLTSLLNIMKFTTQKLLSSVKKPAKLPYLEATAANGFYLMHFNTVFLSINVLRGALYSKGNRPEYINFGSLGTIIAHEMNHAFDAMGQKFNKNGEFKNWWNHETQQKHFKTLECIAQQYSTFTNLETGNKVNGRLTLSENFADIGGIEVAYRAYHDWPKHGELMLQDFQKYTPQKMFWLAFATVRCAKNTKESVLKHEKNAIHSEKRIRINGAAMNSEEFATDWQCRENTPMNPIEKCSVWK